MTATYCEGRLAYCFCAGLAGFGNTGPSAADEGYPQPAVRVRGLQEPLIPDRRWAGQRAAYLGSPSNLRSHEKNAAAWDQKRGDCGARKLACLKRHLTFGSWEAWPGGKDQKTLDDDVIRGMRMGIVVIESRGSEGIITPRFFYCNNFLIIGEYSLAFYPKVFWVLVFSLSVWENWAKDPIVAHTVF